MDNDVAKRLIDLLGVIKPSLPKGIDYTPSEKAALYDKARAILYDDRGALRPLNPRLSKRTSIIVIATLSAMSWAVVYALARGGLS